MKHSAFSIRAGGGRAPAQLALFGLALVCVLGGLGISAGAATRTWVGTSSDNAVWSDPDNWSPAGVPQNGDSLTFIDRDPFGIYSTVNDLSNLSLNTILFTYGGYSISGDAITLIQGITDNHSMGGPNRFRCDIQFVNGGGRFNTLDVGQLEITGFVSLANNQDLIITALTSNITVSGVIQGDGGLVKRGDGALFLRGSGANTYTGPTSIEGGAVHLAKTSAARSVSAVVTLDGSSLPGSPSLADHLPGQYPPVLSMLITNGGIWRITNGATVTNLVLAESGIIEGSGLLTLQCDVRVTRRDFPIGFAAIDCPIYLGDQTNEPRSV